MTLLGLISWSGCRSGSLGCPVGPSLAVGSCTDIWTPCLWSVHPVPGALLAFFLTSAPCSWLPYSLVPWTWLCADCMDWQDCIFHVFFGVFLWHFCSLPGLFLGASQPWLLLLLGPSYSVLDGVGLPGCIQCFSPLSDALFRLQL